MLTRLWHISITLALLTALLCTAGAAGTGSMSGDEYLKFRKSLGASAVDLPVLKNKLPEYIGRTVEFKGVVNGIARCGDSVSFLLNLGGESLLVKTGGEPPKCIENGSTIRALIKIGPESVAGLSDLQLAGAAFDYDVSRREKELTPKVQPKTSPKPQSKPQPAASQSRDSNKKAYPSATAVRGVNLSSRAMQIYDPYKRAIARLNPRLTSQQVDTITASILAFSERYNVDPRLVVSLFIVESGFKPTATSPKGAMGLGQLMPGTARGLGVTNAYDPVQNIEASIRLISRHIDNYDDVILALSAYNAGPGAVRKYNGVPPYRETQNYIRKVTQIYKALCGE